LAEWEDLEEEEDLAVEGADSAEAEVVLEGADRQGAVIL